MCYLFYSLTMILSKLSIGWFLLRLTVKRLHIWILWTSILLTVVTGVVFFFVSLLQCSPVSYFWDKTQEGSCLPIEVIIALAYLYSALNVICDFTFALLPIALIAKLNMKTRTKLTVIPIISMACM